MNNFERLNPYEKFELIMRMLMEERPKETMDALVRFYPINQFGFWLGCAIGESNRSVSSRDAMFPVHTPANKRDEGILHARDEGKMRGLRADTKPDVACFDG